MSRDADRALFLVNLLIEPLQVVVETLDFAQAAASVSVGS